MCIRKFFTYTFSNREAFNQSKKEVEKNHSIDTIEGKLCIITNSRGLDVNRESYEVLKAKTSYTRIAFGNWQEFEGACKLVHEQPLCGEITVEVNPDAYVISLTNQIVLSHKV